MTTSCSHICVCVCVGVCVCVCVCVLLWLPVAVRYIHWSLVTACIPWRCFIAISKTEQNVLFMPYVLSLSICRHTTIKVIISCIGRPHFIWSDALQWSAWDKKINTPWHTSILIAFRINSKRDFTQSGLRIWHCGVQTVVQSGGQFDVLLPVWRPVWCYCVQSEGQLDVLCPVWRPVGCFVSSLKASLMFCVQSEFQYNVLCPVWIPV